MLQVMKEDQELPFKPKVLEKRVQPTKDELERRAKFEKKYSSTVKNLIDDNNDLIIDPYQKELIHH